MTPINLLTMGHTIKGLKGRRSYKVTKHGLPQFSASFGGWGAKAGQSGAELNAVKTDSKAAIALTVGEKGMARVDREAAATMEAEAIENAGQLAAKERFLPPLPESEFSSKPPFPGPPLHKGVGEREKKSGPARGFMGSMRDMAVSGKSLAALFSFGGGKEEDKHDQQLESQLMEAAELATPKATASCEPVVQFEEAVEAAAPVRVSVEMEPAEEPWTAMITRAEVAPKPEKEPSGGASARLDATAARESVWQVLLRKVTFRRQPVRMKTIQTELALERVAVIRNDLSDDDLEIRPRKAVKERNPFKSGGKSRRIKEAKEEKATPEAALAAAEPVH